MSSCEFVVSLRITCVFQLSRRNIERSTPMPAFFVRFSRCIALAFDGIDMYDDRVIRAFHLSESLDERRNVVTFANIHIVKPHGAEKIVLAFAVGVSEFFEVSIQSAVVLCYRHLIVIHHNYEVGTQFRCPIQAFESLSTAQRTVSYHGYNVVLFTFEVSSFCQSACKADRCGGVTDYKVIMFAFRRLRIARNVIVMLRRHECLGSSGKHFVRIALVRNVEDDFVLRRIENIVHCNGCLDHSEVRSAVSAMFAQLFDE